LMNEQRQIQVAGTHGFADSEVAASLVSVDIGSAGGQQGDFFVMPLRAQQRQAVLGAFLLATDHDRDIEDLSALEVFSASVSIALEKQALQQHLFQSEKLAGMGRLVGGVAHELNNPLTAVLGYTEILAGEGSPDTPDAQRGLDVIRRESLRMKRIIDNLQRFSRKQQVKTSTVDLAAALHEVLRLREYDLQKRNVMVTLNIPEDLPPVAADEALLNQALLNLLNNAIDAVEESQNRSVSFSAHADEAQVVLRVADNGPGFADVHRIFDPFYSTKEPGKGTGLGLSVCYSIVRDHGGQLEASNVEPHGACITMTLPAAREAVSRA
jgi:two-component system, NtrC family, sensor kinase